MDVKESRRVNNTGGEFLATASKRTKRDWNSFGWRWMRHVEAAQVLVRGREKFERGDKMYLGVYVASTAAKIKCLE